MAGLTKKQVLHVANLAKLPVTDEEISTFSKQLSEVVNYFEELKDVDTSNVSPTHQTTGLTDVFREDNIQTERILDVSEAVSGSQKVYNNLFVVERLIDNK